MGFTDPNYWKQSPPPQTGDMNNERYLNQKAVLELPGAQIPQELTIADGSISPTRAAVVVDTEGGGVADDLEAINTAVGSGTETLHNGMLITLRAKDQARVVTVKNSAAANGINTAGGHDVVLSTEWDLVLRLVAGRWYEIQTRGDVRASDAQTDASTALARTAPATTTSRGIARVATLADMEPDAVIENGPAVLAAGSEAVTPTPTANAVPQADASGKLDAWVPGLAELENKANADLSNLEPAAEEVIRSKMTLRNLGTRTTTGDWTLTDVKIGRPLWIAYVPSNNDSMCNTTVRVISGATIGSSVYYSMFLLGRWPDWGSANNLLVKPTSTTVVLNISEIHGTGTIYAEQI